MKKQHSHKKFNSLEDIKKSGFTTPDGFLDAFENDIFTKIKEEKLPSKNGFDIPKGYFENLEDSIIAQVNSEKKTTKVVSLKSRIFNIIPYAAAASVLLFIGLNYFSTSNNSVTFDELSATEIENWLQFDYNSDDMAIVLQEVEFNEADYTSTIESNEIEDYLDNIDTTTLLNEIN